MFEVRQACPLTEKVWNNIKPELIQYLDEMDAHRKARGKQWLVLSPRRSSLALPNITTLSLRATSLGIKQVDVTEHNAPMCRTSYLLAAGKR
ncbi:hypothetical protein EDD85DRAFT_1021041 [Armillaria nabsnona]|nr:hypothetical protein EDD85DRAFT_1021041 [Armillaria nabsnona]